MLGKHSKGPSAKVVAVSGRQVAAQVGNDGVGRQRSQGGKGWAAGRKQARPTELVSLKDAARVHEGDAKAVVKQVSLGSWAVRQLWHWMVWVEDKAWQSIRRRADASNDGWAGKSGGAGWSRRQVDSSSAGRGNRQTNEWENRWASRRG